MTNDAKRARGDKGGEGGGTEDKARGKGEGRVVSKVKIKTDRGP